MFKILRYRITIVGMLLGIAITALGINFLILPALEVQNRCDQFICGCVMIPVPFWPSYWRRLRHVPRPHLREEILRSDDGGLILMAIITTTIGLLLAYRFRRYLIRRV